MSWILKLYQTYENCQSEIGRISSAGDETNEKAPLLPVAHTTMNAQLELTLNRKGECKDVKVLEKKRGVTVIPCTEESASRSGTAPIHHPLFDKLQYMAGDYESYGGKKGREFYENYINDLELWCDSSFANEKVKIICDYLKKGRLIGDLVEYGGLICGEDGLLLEKWNGRKEDTPAIFKALPGSQLDAAVRIKVDILGDMIPEIWKDPQVYQDYIGYYLNSRQDQSLCYATGEWASCSELHPKKIVPFEANAKLVSANDTQGFTYRGRFDTSGQVVGLSYEVSQKAHNALRWLIDKQGYTIDKQCFLAWGTKDQLIPPITGSALDLVELFERRDREETTGYTNEAFAKRMNRALAGYGANLKTNAEVVILGLLAATPGRLSITFYRELTGNVFLENLRKWHETCSWQHRYGVDKETRKRFPFLGAPSPKDIIAVGYGSNCNDKLKRAFMERILCCIADAGRFPVDMMRTVVNKASNLISFKEEWERDKTLTIACALYRKYYFDQVKEELPMQLERNRTDRSYLYGRLLAVVHYMELRTFQNWNERDTNAMRYQCTYSKRPNKTWMLLRENLKPYESKLLKGKPGTLRYCYSLLEEINVLFQPGEYEDNAPLTPLYLHGFDLQMQDFWSRKKEKSDEDTEEDIEKDIEENPEI